MGVALRLREVAAARDRRAADGETAGGKTSRGGRKSASGLRACGDWMSTRLDLDLDGVVLISTEAAAAPLVRVADPGLVGESNDCVRVRNLVCLRGFGLGVASTG